MTIQFNQVGAFKGTFNGPDVLKNPTSIQFGPDGRLYVSEQNGTINAFTISLEQGEYVATDHEELLLANDGGVVKSITNHNDQGEKEVAAGRQVTGLVVTGTEDNPVLYISSSDPRISTNSDANLDTNSGVLTRVTWTGSEWESVDLIRGLPRSEENHSNNGMVLSDDGTKLYLTVGGNTNNGAPSQFFTYTGEYALSGTVLEIDLVDIESRPILTDPEGGQVSGSDAARSYIYDLPTLDDPSVANDGVREDENGMDVNGPWGGNDGFNMAILPADAPLRIYADGFRNHYDIVMTESGQLYTVDNGSNSGLGGNPVVDGNGEATNLPNDGGSGNPEPLFLIEDGEFYGHPAPVRANQDLAWTVYDDDANPDSSLSVNSVPDLSALVPDPVNIEEGYVIDPSKFTDDPDRLSESGVRVEYNDPDSKAIVTIGSSSNGLVEYTADSFDGALDGALLVAQFNGSVTALNLNEEGTALEPLIGPGEDNILGTADDVVIDEDGVYSIISGLSIPLDVTTGPDGSVWVTEIGGDFIKVFIPSDVELPPDPDFDNDGIDNISDPFIRDADNGTSVTLFPGETLLWDFDANQDNNLVGEDGYGGGLTGVMIDGITDFELFFQEESDLADQDIKLDNVKFITAAGGGTTVVENVSNGDPLAAGNNGEYLFHTGVSIDPTVDTFSVEWTVFNPASELTGPMQEIGGYIGTGDQSNYLKIVATQSPAGEIQVLLEDNDQIVASSFIQADDLFDVPPNQKIFFELSIDPTAAIATPTITYETGTGTSTVSGTTIDLTGTAVLDAILGNYSVQGQTTGLAVGLLSSNAGQSPEDTFQAIFDNVEITASNSSASSVLYRVNAGGPEVVANDGGIAWSADTKNNNSSFLTDAGSNSTGSSTVTPGATVAPTTPAEIFDTNRSDKSGGSDISWAFDTPEAGDYEVRLFMGNSFNGTSQPGTRVFDIAIEGQVLDSLNDIDLSDQFGHQVGGMISNTVTVTDGTLNIDIFREVENPLINGIEILKLSDTIPSDPTPTISIVGAPYTAAESDPQVQISLLSNLTVPSDETVDVTLEIVPNDALPQVDYEYLSGTFDPQTGIYTDTVTIAGGSSDATILINILQDTIFEGNQNFVVNIVSVSSNAKIGVSSATVTIEDDETANIVSLAAGGNAAEPNANSQFIVSLSEAASTDTTLSYIVAGTATYGADYEALPQTVTILAGELSATIDVNVVDDAEIEGAETVTLILGEVTSGDENVVVGAQSTGTITITDDEVAQSTVLYRVNAGGPEVAAIDGGVAWSADTKSNNSPFLAEAGSNSSASFSALDPGATVADTTPGEIFDTERYESAGSAEMAWAFDTPEAGDYEVRLFVGNGFGGTNDAGERVFDVAIEGQVLDNLSDIDLSDQFGHQVGGMISNTVTVTDGTLDIEFLSEVENPLINGIEIIKIGGGEPAGDRLAPTASLAQPLADITAETAAPQLITVDFADNVDLNEATIDGDEISVTDSDGNPLTLSFNGAVGNSATYEVTAPGGNWDAADNDAYSVEIVAGSVSDVAGNAIAPTSLGSFDVDIPTIPSSDGAATFSITVDSDNIQKSNFGNDSFLIENVGDKKIVKVELDVTNALYPDTVFDPFGFAGDTISKPITINTNGNTGVIAPDNDSYIGEGGIAGYEGIELFFDTAVNGGFDPGETLGFSVDMDANSIAGAEKLTVDSGTSPGWDVGGVSGAELIGSTVTITFEDGSTASSQLQGVGNQAGSQTLVSQNSPEIPVSLSVNGLSAGDSGTYDDNGPSVIVNGPAGQTARIVLTKGFIQPGENNFDEPYKSQLDAQLAALAATDFPANNAVEFQTVDVVLTGTDQDISDLFNFDGVGRYNFEGEDQLALGFVASAIDPSNDNLPIGPVTQPIYLQFEDEVVVDNITVSVEATVEQAAEPSTDGQFTVSLSEVATTDTTLSYTVGGTATSGVDYEALPQTVTILAGELSATVDVTVIDDLAVEGAESVTFALNDVTSGDANVVIGAANADTLTIADNDEPLVTESTVLYRVNAGGREVAAIDGSMAWSADRRNNNSPFLSEAGINKTSGFDITTGDSSLPDSTPLEIFQTERWDDLNNPNMTWSFDTPEAGVYEVRLFMGNGYAFTNDPGDRVFDVAIEGVVSDELNDVDLAAQFGHRVGGMISSTVSVTDGSLDIEFIHEVQNPLINGIEIVQLG